MDTAVLRQLAHPTRMWNRLGWRLHLLKLRRRGTRRVALASFPRSGNTWFRFLLENATGELTGNAGEKPSRILPRGREGLVIKTHQRDSYRYTHAVHLVRNPFDVLDSYYDWKAANGWPWKYGQLEWEEFVQLALPLWRQHTRHWLAARTKTLLVRYEDCLKDPVHQFSAILQWLGRPVPEDQVRAAVEATAFDKLRRTQQAASPVAGKFFRRGEAAAGVHRFSPEQRRWVMQVARRELEECGYTELLNS